MPRSIRIELPDDITNDDYADVAEAVRMTLEGLDQLDAFYVRTDRQITVAEMAERFPGWEKLQGRSGLE
ncbi:hypothetical protein [Nocardioides sp.]|uniref:hypothetical protein n=1 Tax=Nocardioides sp. TaxID=35761 RepID=UPI002632FFCC|nr:hypothetical protein [Nocardioides sp.]